MVSASAWAPSLVAVAGISLVSLIGAVGLVVKRDWLSKGLFFIVAFAAGALLGDAFFHLVPEISESQRGFDNTASV
ncbi:MAG TPA: ZIP family metal transporter, partial [Actinomycetota bacterium]|nr:ZIP family metal transporter [Actinomycetota bacterium]